MKLLIFTQKIDQNDEVLGFFHTWVREFAQSCEKVTVICLEKRSFNLPQNVEVISLGKEKGLSFFMRIYNFYWLIFEKKNSYDVVFVHMNPEYLVLGGFIWKILRKKTALWYTHKSVDLKLRIAEKLTNYVFTAAKESFRLNSKKVKVLGHGIDIKQFVPKVKIDSEVFTILHVGRISAVKNLDVLIEATRLLQPKLSGSLHLVLVGSPVTGEDFEYRDYLISLIQKYGLAGVVTLQGGVPNREVASIYQSADITVNTSTTGGVDKSVLESMACGIPSFSSTEAFRNYFGPYAQDFMFREKDPEDLALKITNFLERKDQKKIADFLISSVRSRASVKILISRILEILKPNETSQ